MAAPEYCTVQDLRDEGVPVSVYDDARVLNMIRRASLAIDRVTGQWFEPRTRTILLDGRRTRFIRLNFPIISITSVSIDDSIVDSASYVVYNRHLSGLDDPDDRKMPRIEMKNELDISDFDLGYPARWPKGQQNIKVIGSFGYTDYDEGVTTEGVTPDGIKQLCMHLVLPELPDMYDIDARDDFSRRSSIKQLKTRDQSITFGGTDTPLTSLARTGLTGRPEIDQLILFYRRPSKLTAV